MALPFNLPPGKICGYAPSLEGVCMIEATCITGFESASKSEVEDRLGDALKSEVFKRQGRILFDLPSHSLPLLRNLRTVDNLYVIIGLESGIDFKSLPTEGNLEMLQEKIHSYSWNKGLDARKRLIPDTPDLPSFRCTCYRSGQNHNFTSTEVAKSVGGAIQDKFKWGVKMKEFDIEVVLNVDIEQVYCGIALNKISLYKRTIEHFGPTTLRATICSALLKYANIQVGDVVVDPMCGGGSIPLEGALGYSEAYHLGGEIHEKAYIRAAMNLNALIQTDENGKRSYRTDLCRWDVTKIPLRDNSVDVFVTDLPFGKRSGSRINNAVLYPKIMLSMARVVRPTTGRAVLLTQDRTSMFKAFKHINTYWKLTRQSNANIGGLTALIFFFSRTNESPN